MICTLLLYLLFICLLSLYASVEKVWFSPLVSHVSDTFTGFPCFCCPFRNDVQRMHCNNSLKVVTQHYSNIPHLSYSTFWSGQCIFQEHNPLPTWKTTSSQQQDTKSTYFYCLLALPILSIHMYQPGSYSLIFWIFYIGNPSRMFSPCSFSILIKDVVFRSNVWSPKK